MTPFVDFTRDDIVFLRTNMLKGNLWLFLDIYPSHIYYKSNPQDFYDAMLQEMRQAIAVMYIEH